MRIQGHSDITLRRLSDSGRKSAVPQVMMAPLIDVIFLLLIFFMLVARFLSPGIDLDLPVSSSTAVNESVMSTLTVSADGNFWLDNILMSLDEVTAQLSTDFESGAIEAVRLRIDGSAESQLLVGAVEAIHDAGITSLSIETDSEDDSTMSGE